MLSIRYLQGSLATHLGATSGSFPLERPLGIAFTDDPVRDAIRTSILGPISCHAGVDFDTLPGGTGVHYKRYTAYDEHPKYNPLTDALTYGGGLYAFFHVLPKNAAEKVAGSKEGLYKSHCLNGTVQFESPDGPFLRSQPLTGASMFGYSYPQFQRDVFQRLSAIDRIEVSNGLIASQHTFYIGGQDSFLSTKLEAMRMKLSKGESVGNKDPQGAVTRYTVLDYIDFNESYSTLEGDSGMSLTISYGVTYHTDNLFNSLQFKLSKKCDITITFDVQTNYYSGSEPMLQSLDARGSLHTHGRTQWYGFEEHQTNLSSDAKAWKDLDKTISSWSIEHDDSQFAWFSSPVAPSLRGLDELETFVLGRRTEFARFVEDKHSSFTAGNFYSTAAAVDDYTTVIESNVLEALAELGEIASLIPDLGGLIAIYRDVKNLKLLRAGKKLLDLITDLHLWKSFGVEPTAEVILDFAHKHDQLYESRVLEGWKILYGKNSVHVTEEGFLPTFLPWIRCESKSKVRVYFDGASVLTAILGLKAGGVLPSPDNLWDCVPFSWIVDMVFNIGGKLEAVTNQGILLLLPCGVGTHSYRVTSEIESQELSEHNGRALKAIELFYFYRGVSCLLPSLRDAEFDYNPPHVSDWSTFGSFVYKTLF